MVSDNMSVLVLSAENEFISQVNISTQEQHDYFTKLTLLTSVKDHAALRSLVFLFYKKNKDISE